MRKITARSRITVAAVVDDGQSPFEFATACEVFGIDRTKDVGRPWYRFLVCSVGGGPVRASTGFEIVAPHGLEAIRKADTIIVPASATSKQPSEDLLEELRRAHARGARLVSLCTGAFTLAAAGLLDGRRATTHWMHSDELAATYPDIKLDPDVLYVDEGDILTSAGTAAGVDLCLHIVRLDYGADVANYVARRMVVPPVRDGGQAQFVADPVPDLAPDDPFATTLVWVVDNLHQPLGVDDLARRSAMSPRSFARRFRATTGTTPHQWLLRQRVLLAQRLLETTELPIEIVAARCGLGSSANLRQHFQRIVRTSPNAYRRTFRTATTA